LVPTRSELTIGYLQAANLQPLSRRLPFHFFG
jgi:hypothetical protein